MTACFQCHREFPNDQLFVWHGEPVRVPVPDEEEGDATFTVPRMPVCAECRRQLLGSA